MSHTTRLATTPATDWRNLAGCRNADPELFFPARNSPLAVDQETEAKKICNQCPVVSSCLEWALETRQEAGVWGGLTEGERLERRVRSKMPRFVAQPVLGDRKHQSHRYPGYATAVDGIIGTRLEEVQDLVEQKASVHELASALGTNMPTVRRVLERLDQPAVDGVVEADYAAVNRFVQGFVSDVKDADFLAAVQICVGRGMTLAEVDRLHMWDSKTTEYRVNRLRKRYQRAGWEFPSLMQPTVRRFSDEEIVAIREKSQSGAADVELAMAYDVKRETIRSICRGLSYRHVGGPIRGPRAGSAGTVAKEWGSGHAANSLAAGVRQDQMGEAA